MIFINTGVDYTYPTGIGALSAFLKNNGHHTKLLNIVTDKPKIEEHYLDRIEKELNDFRPKVVGFTVFETGFHWLKQICDFIKKIDPSIITVAGGYYPTLAPEEVISCESLDIICRGEGEHALLELVDNLENNREIKAIRNLWVKIEGEVYRNEVGPLIENLDDLPFWDREMFDYQSHIDFAKKGRRNVKVMASRGCPYRCTYCSNAYFKGIYPNKDKYLRIRSVDHLIEELLRLKSAYDFDYVGFHDDNLTLFPDWLVEFSKKYREKIKLPFYCAARVETCTDKILNYLKKAGCFMVLIGIESGDEQYRKELMKREMTNKLIVDACRRIKEQGMLLWTFNMVGMPRESKKQLLRTVWLNWKIGPDFAMTSVFYPFKGTEMGDRAYREGLVSLNKKGTVASYAKDSILDLPDISALELKIAKYLTIFSAMRSTNGFFYQAIWERFRNFFS